MATGTAVKKAVSSEVKRPITFLQRFIKILGPGLITGAADDDPSGIATYTQTDAQFGYGQLWTVLFTLPLMTAIQEACARIGAVTGKGLATVTKENYRKSIAGGIVSLVVVANIINIGADISAMAAASALIVPIDISILALGITAIILLLEIFSSYQTYARILKWLTLSLLAYPVILFVVRTPWITLLKSTFIPHIEFTYGFFFLLTGVLGTTISPYMFFWQASEEVEEEISHNIPIQNGRPSITGKDIRNLRIDNLTGMVFSQIATWCIIVVAATVLNRNGIYNVNTAADAAKALEPLVDTFTNSGFYAKSIFAGLSVIASELANLVNKDCRVAVLGHLQHGGSPNAFDRTLASSLASAAVDAIEKGMFGQMIALKSNLITSIPL